MSFKILLTAWVTGTSAVTISLLTKSAVESKLFSILSSTLSFGFAGVGGIIFLYNKRFNNIREKIEELGD